jgi:uncharacterized low-complexity protein
MTVPRRAGVLAGLLVMLACALPGAALAAPTVTVRVEGRDATLLPATRVTLGERPLPAGCANADSALAALDAATGGAYVTASNGVIQTILGETHAFATQDYWAFWIRRGDRFTYGGAPCAERLADGDELEVHVDELAQGTFLPTVFPIVVEGLPATVVPGAPVTVTVVEYRAPTGTPGEGERTPRAGATVTLGAATATTDADGRATLTVPAAGPLTLRAAAGANRSATLNTCATTGADGLCGTTSAPAPGTPAAPACITTGDDGRCGTRDRRPPVTRIRGIAEQAVFPRARAPRRLAGTVEADPSGVRMVKLRLTRRHAGRCSAFSKTRERFRPVRCGTGWSFRIGESASWSYLLPERLGPGRYVLDVVAIDGAYNRDVLARGRSRVVFTVR